MMPQPNSSAEKRESRVIDNEKQPLPWSHRLLLAFALCFFGYLVYLEPLYLLVILVALASGAIWHFAGIQLRQVDSLKEN
jgi:hypothetical protein